MNVDNEPGTDELYPTNEVLSEGDTVAIHGSNQSATTGEDDKTEAHGVGTSPEANVDKFRGKMTDADLAALAISNPQQANRILYNRMSAARSRKRKAKHTSEQETRINTLQIQLAKSCAQQASQDCQMSALRLQNQQLEQENQLSNAIIAALTAENKRLQIMIRSQVVQNSRTTTGQAGMMPFGVPQNLAAMIPQFYGRPRTINQQPGIGPSLWSAQQLQQQQLQPSQAPHPPQAHQMILQQHVDQQPGISPSLRSAQQLEQLQPSQAPHQRPHQHPSQPHQMWRPQHVEAAGEGAHAAGEGGHDAGEGANAQGQGQDLSDRK